MLKRSVGKLNKSKVEANSSERGEGPSSSFEFSSSFPSMNKIRTVGNTEESYLAHVNGELLKKYQPMNRFAKLKLKKVIERKLMQQQEMTEQSRIQELETEINRLSATCKCLEAQNIIAAAQMVDFMTLSIGNFVSLSTYFIYQKIIWWIFAESNCCSYYIGISEIKWILLLLPYLYNRFNYGVVNRRFHVFAVAFVMIARIKLTRWRVNTFAVTSKHSQQKSVTNQNQDDGIDTDDKTSNKENDNFGNSITEDDIWDANYEINARFLYSSILRLKGLWTKSAQYISSRADFVPLPYVRELSKLQDEAPKSAWKDIEKILRKNGILEHFDVDHEPIASASIGQVHVAYFKDRKIPPSAVSQKVVVKVQHPHADTLLSDDFVSLRIIARIISILEPEYKFFEILMKEWANESIHELDFNKELDNLVSAGAAISAMERSMSMAAEVRTNDDGSDSQFIPFSVEVPRPFKLFTNRHVLVMTFCEGARIDDSEMIARCDIPKEAIMNAVSQTNAYMMYCSDIFSGDPHPGNLFLRPGLTNGETFGFTIILLDWGLAKRLPEEKRIGFCQMTYGAATFDFGLLMDGFKTLGLKLKRENVAEDMAGIRFMLRDMAPRDIARRRVKNKMKSDRKNFSSKQKGDRVPVESDAYPGEFFFFVRTNELLHGLGSRLGVQLGYLDILKSFALTGLKQSKHYGRNIIKPDPIHDENIFDWKLQAKIEKTLKSLPDIAGAQVCLLNKEGDTLAHIVTGHLGSLKSHLSMRSDSLVLGFSVTKAISATLVHVMVEKGYMDYDEPICKRIWTNFCPTEDPPSEVLDAIAWRWKRSITLRHILTHTSGLWSATPYDLTIQKLSCCEICCKTFEYNNERLHDTLLPTHEPGSQCIYHPLSFGWLVAGCVIGAYSTKHGQSISYREIYEELMLPRLSKTTKESGFHPCGGDLNSHDLAYFDAEVKISQFLQRKREAEEMGERLSIQSSENDFGTDMSTNTKMQDILKSIRGREFLLDVRIWNSRDGLIANVPSAGGRFTAKGLASFYNDLGSGRIVSSPTLDVITTPLVEENGLQELQGQTVFSNSNIGKKSSSSKTSFALGYQILELPKNVGGTAIGHAGVGGSLGLLHIESGVSVGIMFNKSPQTIGERNITRELIDVISKHLQW